MKSELKQKAIEDAKRHDRHQLLPEYLSDYSVSSWADAIKTNPRKYADDLDIIRIDSIEVALDVYKKATLKTVSYFKDGESWVLSVQFFSTKAKCDINILVSDSFNDHLNRAVAFLNNPLAFVQTIEKGCSATQKDIYKLSVPAKTFHILEMISFSDGSDGLVLLSASQLEYQIYNITFQSFFYISEIKEDKNAIIKELI